MTDDSRIPVSIFGSCVTRDAFEFITNTNISLATYLARESVFSVMSPPVTFSEEELKASSAFRKRMVMHDLSKDAFHIFSSDTSKYLIIDLIDERFDIARFRSSVVTVSAEFVESGISENNKLPIIKKDINDPDIERMIDVFCDSLKRIYCENHIIIHKCYFVDSYITNTGEEKSFPLNVLGRNRRYNNLIEQMYKCLQNNIPDAYAIDICSSYKCSEAHKWGLSPMHFEDAYYRKVADEVEKYIIQNESKNVCRGEL